MNATTISELCEAVLSALLEHAPPLHVRECAASHVHGTCAWHAQVLSVLLGCAFVDYCVKATDDTARRRGWGAVWDAPLVVLGLPILLVARAANIFLVSAVANRWLP